MRRKYTDEDLEWLEQFGDRLKRLIHKYGKTQKQVACELGIDESVLSKYITGKHAPNVYIVSLLAKSLDCEVKQLFDESF